MTKKQKKHLLGEGVTTRFMGLAGIGALSPQFVKNKYGKSTRRTLRESDEEELDEVVTDEDLVGRQTEKGARLSEMPEDDMGMEDDMPPEDDMPMDDEPEGGMGGEVDVESLVTALADVIETHTGVPVDVEGASGEESMDDMGGMDMDDEEGMDDMDMGDEEEMMEASEALARAGYELDENTGKYFKSKKTTGVPGKSLSENKKEDVKETKKVQKEGEKEELDEEAQELKSQMPNDPGKVKTGKTERVKGAEKPGPVESTHADHALKNGPKPNLKTLEERVMKRVLTKLKEELASRSGRSLKKK